MKKAIGTLCLGVSLLVFVGTFSSMQQESVSFVSGAA